MSELHFKGGNPGAVQYGNFINYYQFHPPENRLELLPPDIWPEVKHIHVLDIGSNAGDLTILLSNFLAEKVGCCNILGIEIDPTLVQRSKEKVQPTQNIQFCCADFMSDASRQPIQDYLKEHNLTKFDAVFIFSITMWIHLNHGDAGLEKFLRKVCELSDLIIIEPQPWKCYRTAVKRMKLSNAEFPLFKDLKIKQTVEEDIKTYLSKQCGMTQIYQSDLSKWGRRLNVFKHISGT